MRGWLRMVSDTVCCDTPAARATSRLVTRGLSLITPYLIVATTELNQSTGVVAGIRSLNTFGLSYYWTGSDFSMCVEACQAERNRRRTETDSGGVARRAPATVPYGQVRAALVRSDALAPR